MVVFNRIPFLLILCVGVNEFGLIASQDVSSFLGQLMKNYMAKNTRYYTILNGVPVQESVDGPPDNSEIISRISSILPEPIANSPVLSQILEQDANSFPNSWTPMMAEAGNSGSYPALPPSSNPSSSTLGRRYGAEATLQHPPYFQHPAHESPIITLEDIPAQFNIQSTMALQK